MDCQKLLSIFPPTELRPQNCLSLSQDIAETALISAVLVHNVHLSVIAFNAFHSQFISSFITSMGVLSVHQLFSPFIARSLTFFPGPNDFGSADGWPAKPAGRRLRGAERGDSSASVGVSRQPAVERTSSRTSEETPIGRR